MLLLPPKIWMGILDIYFLDVKTQFSPLKKQDYSIFANTKKLGLHESNYKLSIFFRNGNYSPIVGIERGQHGFFLCFLNQITPFCDS